MADLKPILNTAETNDEERLKRRIRKNKLTANKCLFLVFVFIFACLIGLIMTGYINYYHEREYENVFHGIKISSKYDDGSTKLHKVIVQVKSKNFRMEHSLVPSKRVLSKSLKTDANNNSTNEENFLCKFYDSFNKAIDSLNHRLDYDSSSKSKSFMKIYEKKKFKFHMTKLDSIRNKSNNKNVKHHNHDDKSNEIECYNVNVTNHVKKTATSGEIEACLNLNEHDAWFGGHESLQQPFWPINNQTFDYVAYEPGFPDEWGAVYERYWLSSSGLAIYIDDSVPLFVKHDQNGKRICFKSSNQSLPYAYAPIYEQESLTYTMCMGPDIKTVQRFMAANFLGSPTTLPDMVMMRSPIWTTWNYYFKHINSSVVLDFAKQIVANNYTYSQLEIDDKWESEYGDLEFSPHTFGDINELTKKLHDMKFRVTLWVHPFCNIDSKNFINGSYAGYWVREPSGQHPAFTSWWNGNTSTIIDTTNPHAVSYFKSKLNDLKKAHGIDSFKFDAGEAAWIPREFSMYDTTAKLSTYTRNYVAIAADQNNLVEVRTANRIQTTGIFYRILDRSSDWTIHDGLKSVITATLQFGLLGYKYVLPDMIGGNSGPDKSQKELFIRWTQLTAFLPAMQFGVPPWYFDEQTNVICRRYVQLREQYVFPYLSNLTMRLDNDPLIRPMWWSSSSDPQTFTISDQFLVGDDLLVAPVLDAGAKSRRIFFPPGDWLDFHTKQVYKGPLWSTYTLSLEDIPFFFLNKNNSNIFNF